MGENKQYLKLPPIANNACSTEIYEKYTIFNSWRWFCQVPLNSTIQHAPIHPNLSPFNQNKINIKLSTSFLSQVVTCVGYYPWRIHGIGVFTCIWLVHVDRKYHTYMRDIAKKHKKRRELGRKSWGEPVFVKGTHTHTHLWQGRYKMLAFFVAIQKLPNNETLTGCLHTISHPSFRNSLKDRPIRNDEARNA